MMLILNKLNKGFSKNVHKILKTPSQMRKLEECRDLNINLIAKVIDDIKRNNFSEEEKEWIDKIKSIRNDLNLSNDNLEIKRHSSEGVTIRIEKVSNVYNESSILHKWGLLLFKLVRTFKPSSCLELGTCVGVSALYQVSAMELNQKGNLVTLEGIESFALLAKRNIERLVHGRATVVVGKFKDTLGNVLNEYKNFDFAFIDGHHDEIATISYFKQISPFLADGSVLIFDDILWSDGMERAWNQIIQDENIKASIDLFKMGVCLFTRQQAEKFHFKIAF